LVSKRNRNRKTAEKIAKPAEKPAEKIAKPAEINVEQILTAVTQKVVEVLKPDLEQKVTAVQTALSNQIKAEMQDLREHLPTLPQQPVESDGSQPPTPEGTQPPTVDPLSQTPQTPQTQNQQLVSSLLPLMSQFIKPANSNNELMSMFMQTAMRKEMSKATMSDWLQEAVMKKFANEFLQTDYPSDVESATKHFMKPIRDIGVRAEQAKQASENKQ